MIIIKEEEIKQKIIEILTKRPGLTIENLAEEIGVHRHTIAKYILELKGAGRIQKRRIGTAVLHYLTEQVNDKLVIGEPITEESAEEAIESEEETKRKEKPLEKASEELEKPKSYVQKESNISHKRVFKYSMLSLFVIGILFSIYLIVPQITGFFVFGDKFDKTSGLFITGDDSLSKNELSVYTLLKGYGGNVSKVRISDLKSVNLSEYDYMVISNDASAFITDEICQLIAYSNTPFLYSSRNFNNKCEDELRLASSSICGPNESPIWIVINNSYYPTSHISTVPKKVKVFTNEFSVDLCAIEGNGLYSKPFVLVKRDETHGYIVIFKDNLQKKAFFALPNNDLGLTEEGKTLLGRTLLWLIGE